MRKVCHPDMTANGHIGYFFFKKTRPWERELDHQNQLKLSVCLADFKVKGKSGFLLEIEDVQT